MPIFLIHGGPQEPYSVSGLATLACSCDPSFHKRIFHKGFTHAPQDGRCRLRLGTVLWFAPSDFRARSEHLRSHGAEEVPMEMG